MNSYSFRMLILTAALMIGFVNRGHAQQDAPPVDVQQVLQVLRVLREQQIAQVQAQRQKAIQDVSGAAASGVVAAAAWEEAVRQVQFQGISKEGAQFREWKEREGGALGEKEVQSAARLHFNWMVITLQRSGGVPVKDLMPAILQHIGGVLQDRAGMEALDEKIRHERELGQNNKRPGARDKLRDDELAKRMHDQILNSSVGGAAPAQALKIRELLTISNWEMNPGNVDGIYQSVVLPEFRASKDARLMEYWDMKLRKESDLASKAKLAFDVERFNQVRRPELLWQRAQDMAVLGMKNRAVNEMLSVLKGYPAHPSSASWIGALEKLLMGFTGESGPDRAAAAPAGQALRGGGPAKSE